MYGSLSSTVGALTRILIALVISLTYGTFLGGCGDSIPKIISLEADPDTLYPGGTSTIVAKLDAGSITAAASCKFSASGGVINTDSTGCTQAESIQETFTADNFPGDAIITFTINKRGVDAVSKTIHVSVTARPKRDP